jgi:hypothetical protein
MKIPDLLSPIVAYRTWGWDALGITSLNDTRWVPGEAMKAFCPNFMVPHESSGHGDMISVRDGWEDHHVPAPDCSCGVYAAKNFKHLVDIGYAEHGIHGEVSLWGTVMEHRLGYRAQYAYPKTFVVPESMVPYPAGQMTTQLEGLMLFGVDIFIQFRRDSRESRPQDILFWNKDQGVSQEAVASLLEYRARWYAYKILDATLKDGDRVALQDKGIGIVCYRDEDGNRSGAAVETPQVQVILWNNASYFVKREDIKWSERNNRWEAKKCSQFWESSSILGKFFFKLT